MVVYRKIKRKHISSSIPPFVPKYLIRNIKNKKQHIDSVLTSNFHPQITNFVVTLTLGVHVDVGRITMWLSNTERKPQKFAAVVIRIDGSASGTTCLLFRNGKMVVTGGKTYASAQLAAHSYRSIIETVPQPVILRYKSGKQKLDLSTLARVTSFNNFTVENIVGSGRIIDGAIDLASFVRDYPNSVWIPELFPGLKYTIKLPPLETYNDDDDDEIINNKILSSMMHRNKNTKKEDDKEEGEDNIGRKCTALMFDTGCVVITGAHVKKDVYYAYNHCRQVVKPYKDNNAPIKSRERYAYRVNSMMNNAQRTPLLASLISSLSSPFYPVVTTDTEPSKDTILPNDITTDKTIITTNNKKRKNPYNDKTNQNPTKKIKYNNNDDGGANGNHLEHNNDNTNINHQEHNDNNHLEHHDNTNKDHLKQNDTTNNVTTEWLSTLTSNVPDNFLNTFLDNIMIK